MHLASATRAFGANRPVIFGKVWAAGSRLSCRPGGQGRDLHLNRRPVSPGILGAAKGDAGDIGGLIAHLTEHSR